MHTQFYSLGIRNHIFISILIHMHACMLLNTRDSIQYSYGSYMHVLLSGGGGGVGGGCNWSLSYNSLSHIATVSATCRISTMISSLCTNHGWMIWFTAQSCFPSGKSRLKISTWCHTGRGLQSHWHLFTIWPCIQRRAYTGPCPLDTMETYYLDNYLLVGPAVHHQYASSAQSPVKT